MKWICFLIAFCLFSGCSSNNGNSSEENPVGIDNKENIKHNSAIFPENESLPKEQVFTDTIKKKVAAKKRKDELILPFIQKNICPFEGCKYRRIWRTNTTVTVYKTEDKTEPLFTLKKGESFKTLRGNVHIIKPGKLIITESFQDFKKGEEIAVLSYKGEGVYDLWYKGKVFDKDLPEMWSAQPPKTILKTEPKTEWWIYIVSERGRFGWIHADGVVNFD